MGNGQPKSLRDAVKCGNLQVIDFLLRSHIKLDEGIIAVAARSGRIEVVDILLNAKADVNSKTAGWSALKWAGHRGNLELVKLLLGAKADSSVEIGNALVIASKKGHIEVVDILAPLECSKRSTKIAMMEAAKRGQAKVIETLLKAKPRTDTKNDLGKIMSAAGKRGHLAVVKLLVAKKANVGDDLARPLIEAINRGHVDVVDYLITANANLELKDKYGRTILVNAVKIGADIQVIDLLIEASAELNLSGRNTPLNSAVHLGDIELVKRLLLAKAALENEDVQPLHRAAFKGHFEMVEFLLNSKVSLDVRDKKKRTALMWAVKSGRLEVIETLICLKADPNATDVEGTTALCKATSRRRKCLELTKILVNGKADIDVEKYNALANVAWSGNIETVTFLINAKANLEVRTKEDCTPLMLAARCGHHKVVALLLDAKADFHAKDNLGDTALCMAAMSGSLKVIKELESSKADITSVSCRALTWAAKKGHSKVAEYLVNASANIENEDENGRTPVAIASRHSFPKVVKILIEASADLDKTDSVGDTALSLAGKNGSVTIIKLLVRAKADINGGRLTSLHHAAKKGHSPAVIFLLKSKADIGRQTDDGRSALMLAARNGQSRVTYILIKEKADLNVQDIEGKTAALSAGSRGHRRIVKMLIDAKAAVNVEKSRSMIKDTNSLLSSVSEEGVVDLRSEEEQVCEQCRLLN